MGASQYSQATGVAHCQDAPRCVHCQDSAIRLKDALPAPPPTGSAIPLALRKLADDIEAGRINTIGEAKTLAADLELAALDAYKQLGERWTLAQVEKCSYCGYPMGMEHTTGCPRRKADES
jgi:hypothetical protein